MSSNDDLLGAPLEITNYRMKPSINETFKASKIKQIIQQVLTDKLQGKNYNADDARRWTKDIADEVSLSVKHLNLMTRYKHVVQVTMGQQLGAGCRYVAKCCWDADSDSQASDVFSNTSLFCICTVFGIYLY